MHELVLIVTWPQASRRVDDLFEDLKDGHSLLSLLEVLSGEYLQREKGRMRFHQLQNVETVLNFLRSKNVSTPVTFLIFLCGKNWTTCLACTSAAVAGYVRNKLFISTDYYYFKEIIVAFAKALNKRNCPNKT